MFEFILYIRALVLDAILGAQLFDTVNEADNYNRLTNATLIMDLEDVGYNDNATDGHGFPIGEGWMPNGYPTVVNAQLIFGDGSFIVANFVNDIA